MNNRHLSDSVPACRQPGTLALPLLLWRGGWGSRLNTSADNIVQHYVDLYNVYVNYMDTTMTGADSLTVLTLANLCPYTEGNAVFLARAFYRILNQDDITQFNDQCGNDTLVSDSTGARSANPDGLALRQHYSLFPNPNDGNFTLLQSISDPNKVEISIQNVVGKTVLYENIQFANGRSQLNINQLAPGMYLLKLSDAQNHREQFKFIIQK